MGNALCGGTAGDVPPATAPRPVVLLFTFLVGLFLCEYSMFFPSGSLTGTYLGAVMPRLAQPGSARPRPNLP